MRLNLRYRVTGIVTEYEIIKTSSNQGLVFCILFRANAPEKDMNLED